MEPIIPELLKSVIGSIVRWALTGVFAFLVSKGVIKPEDSELLLVGIAGGVAILAWSLWQKYKSRLQVVTALALPPTSTDKDLRSAIKKSNGSLSVWGLLLFVVLAPLSQVV